MRCAAHGRHAGQRLYPGKGLHPLQRAGERVNDQARRQHIIGLTAAVGPEYERECREAGMDGYLSKPVSREMLVGALERVKALSGV